jgi:hypothetical protein
MHIREEDSKSINRVADKVLIQKCLSLLYFHILWEKVSVQNLLILAASNRKASSSMKDGCSIPYTCGLVLTLNKFVVIVTNSHNIIAIYIDDDVHVNIMPQE